MTFDTTRGTRDPYGAWPPDSRAKESLSQLASSQAPADDRGESHRFPPLGTAIKILMVWPKFPSSFWSFNGMMEMIPEATIHPPLGLLTVAALCPKSWTLRLIDRSFEDLRDEDILWADLVMISGMRVQKEDIRATLGRARALGTRTMIGGPYASSEPEIRAFACGPRGRGRARRNVP